MTVDLDSAEYKAYRRKVIAACVRLMGERSRDFWTNECSWEEDFEANTDPDEVAQNEKDALG